MARYPAIQVNPPQWQVGEAMKRKVVQITSTVLLESVVLHALCDDGTVWRKLLGVGPSWLQLPAIPDQEGAER